MALANFLVVSGSGQGVVISVGNNSHMSELTRGRSYTRDNPISRGLDQFAYAILIISFACTSIYLIVWAAWIRVNYYDSALNVWISILNIIVTGIPVGLPVSIIIGLFVILQKLRQSNIVVKNIFAITSMSGIDVVLTDKTGTLTQNSLEVAGVFYSTKEIDVDLCSQESDVFLGGEAGLRELVEMCDFCTSEDSKTSTNLVEKALLEFSEKNLPKKLIEHYKIENDIEFNSMNKFQARLIKPKDEINIPIDRVISERKSLTNLKNAYVLMIRGAPDFLIPKCKYILNAGEGQTVMSDASKILIEAKMQQWSLMGRRLICFCKKAVTDCENSVLSKNLTTTQEFQKWVNSQLNELTFIGMIGFIDPPRPE
jgi:sodium/potassium-transporting ATPase subunit alpha